MWKVWQLTLIWAGGLAGAAQAEETLSIATLNCEFLNRRTIHVKYGYPLKLLPADEALWRDRTYANERYLLAARAVAAAIKQIDADIIALTEVGDVRDVQDLRQLVAAAGLDYPHLAIGESTDFTTGQNVAMFSRLPLTNVLSSIPGRESYDGELDEPDAEQETGLSKGLMAQFSWADGPVHLYVLHLASELGGHERDAQRVAQASIVRRHYLPALRRGDHVIVAGDINDHRGEPAIRRLRGRDDIDEDLAQVGGPSLAPRRDRETDEDFNVRLRNHWTYEYAGRKEQIDHILLSTSLVRAVNRNVTPHFLDITPTFDDPPRRTTDHRAMKVVLVAE